MIPAGQDAVREKESGVIPEAPLRHPSPLLRLARLLGFTEHRCPVCGTPVDDGGAAVSGPEAGMRAHGLCPACARALVPYVGGRCRACGLPLPWPAAGQPLLCGECLVSPPPWQGLALHGQYREMCIRDRCALSPGQKDAKSPHGRRCPRRNRPPARGRGRAVPARSRRGRSPSPHPLRPRLPARAWRAHRRQRPSRPAYGDARPQGRALLSLIHIL